MSKEIPFADKERLELLSKQFHFIVIKYYGEGDDGSAYLEDSSFIKKGEELDKEDEEFLLDFVERLLGPGWELNEGFGGQFIFDLKNRQIVENQTHPPFETTTLTF